MPVCNKYPTERIFHREVPWSPLTCRFTERFSSIALGLLPNVDDIKIVRDRTTIEVHDTPVDTSCALIPGDCGTN